MESQVIKISVRSLVEFILREGDIDNRIAGSMEKDAMLQGTRIHRKIQKRMGSDYRAEVPLKILYPCDGFSLQIEGRADGIIENAVVCEKIVSSEFGEDVLKTEKKSAPSVFVDEIKSVLRDLEYIQKPIGVHLAQAKCYAYIYATQNNLRQIGVQMTYCQIETEDIKRFREEYTLTELEEWFVKLVKAYEKWAKMQIEWKNIRNTSIKECEFPFPYREGQKELVSSVYRTILRKKKLFIQAPTGVGKTMASVFPAVRAVGEGLGNKIFYLTAKTITRTVAEQAFATLRVKGLAYKTITLTAKEKICFMEETECNPDACPYAKGHYDRVNDAVYDLLQSSEEFTREVLEGQAKKYRVCPFEMMLDVSLWVDAVICDYNYVFDPNAHLKRFFTEGGEGDYIFLIDEAHNLVERGRKMYSAELIKEDVMSVRRLVKTENDKLAKRLEECNKQLLALKKECETYQVLDSVSHIALKLMNVMGELERYLEEMTNPEKKEEVLEFYFQVRSFLNIYENLDENYVIYTEMGEDKRFYLKLFCVNPAENLEQYLSFGNSTIFFSATLLPIHYYKKLLSVETDDYAVYAESTFPQENRLLMLGRDVSTKYTRRGPEMYQKIAEYLLKAVKGKKGNYIAFFPSYRFMTEVYECIQFLQEMQYEEEITVAEKSGADFEAEDAGNTKNAGNTKDEVEFLLQSQFMGEEAREIFLETFEEERDHSLIAFCVMGGIFSEGIDLTEERLIGTMIVGTGLPQVCNEREILKRWFDEREMSGFDYAYLYPGMNKVLQSAGRVIRTETDKGIILLLDERFLDRRYRETFPREWRNFQTCRLENVTESIEEFWKK